MDSVFALTGKDFVLMCSDTAMAHSILKYKSDEDKIKVISNNLLIGMSGEACDRLQFGDLVERNIELSKFRNGMELEISESANFVRKSPYQVNCLIAGIAKNGEPELYWLDYLGTMQKVTRACHGFDKSYSDTRAISCLDLTLEEAKNIIDYCKSELQTRFLMSQSKFITKLITKVKSLELGRSRSP